MDERADSLIVVRPAAELTLKSKRTRSRFMRTLASAVRDALQRNGVDCRVRRRSSRLMVYVPAEGMAVAEEALGRVFGIGSFSPVRASCAADPQAIAETGLRVFGDKVGGRRYAVRVKRLGEHPFGSMDVARSLGAALNPFGTVDLSDPELEVRVEIQDDRAYLFEERVPGAGGLPLGSEARALALLSGGFDSPVAAHRLLRRGVALDFVFFNLAGSAHERLVVQVAKLLADRWCYGSRPHLHVVDFTAVVDELRAETREDYWQVLLKRLMLRGAEQIAGRLGADALVTGESLGQVSSQTLPNLRAIDGAVSLPVLRPLIGSDKRDIIREAAEVGTDALSARVREYCAISSGRPVVAADPAIVAAEEDKLSAELLQSAVGGARELRLRALGPADLMIPYLFVDSVPPGATLLDCQPEGFYRAWHAQGALRADPDELLRDPRRLDANGCYLLYCQHGTRSAQAAEVLQQLGFEAYSFRGGAPALRRFLGGVAGAEGLSVAGRE